VAKVEDLRSDKHVGVRGDGEFPTVALRPPHGLRHEVRLLALEDLLLDLGKEVLEPGMSEDLVVEDLLDPAHDGIAADEFVERLRLLVHWR
jgi:hypothetical protein